MNNINDFEIVNGVLKKYSGKDENIVIPDMVTEVCRGAFSSNKKLKTITFPESVITIDEAFDFCGKLEAISIDNPSCNAFFSCNGCKSLAQIKASEKVTEMILGRLTPKIKIAVCYSYLNDDNKSKAFEKVITRNKAKIIKMIIDNDNAQAITKLFSISSKPWSINDIDDLLSMATDKQNLSAVILEFKNKHYSIDEIDKNSSDNTLKELGVKEKTLAEWRKIYSLRIEKNEITIVKYKGKDSFVTIPEKIDNKPVTSIEDAFKLCGFLKEVVMPDTVEHIGWWTFSECANLQKVQLSKNLKTIGDFVFDDCSSLKEIELPENLKSICTSAFARCDKLKKVTMGNSLEEIDESAFDECPKLTIYAPAGSYAEKYAEKNKIKFASIK